MKKLLSLFLTICLVLLLPACAGTPAAPVPPETAVPAEQPSVPETETAVAAGYPMTLVDQAGREILLPAEPRRIISSYYISTSALIALGLQERLVGVEVKPEKRTIYHLSAPELMALPTVGTAKELDLEGCIALNPDLVVLPLKLKGVVEQLEQLGIPVLLVNPESQELLLDMLELLAAAANVPERAQALRGFVDTQTAVLSGITGEAPSVYLGGNSAFLSTAGGKMYQSDLIALAGGRNVAADLPDTYWAEISYEQLLAWDPEYIVLAADASYFAADVCSDPNLSDCRAVRSGNVFRIPNQIESWDSPLPGSILGALWIASVLHPDQITQEYTNETISSFYTQFYGFPCDAETLLSDSVGN